MKTCGKCGGDICVKPIPRYQLKKELVGGMHIELTDSSVGGLVCEKCGEVLRIDIPDRPRLLTAVAVSRCKESLKLNGGEIRFMRKAMNLTGSELAEKIKVSEETVSRWENGHLAIGSHAERIFRWRVCQALGEQAPAIAWNDDEILSMNIISVSDRPLVLTLYRGPFKRREQWRDAA